MKEQPDHAKRMLDFARKLIDVAKSVQVDEDNPDLGHIDVRVGVHSGPCVSNVVGSRCPRFCLFGDTVNTAAKIESLSFPKRVHCSQRTFKLATRQGSDQKLTCRGDISLQGKGDLTTYWVDDDSTPTKKEEPKAMAELYSQFEW